ncbi:hypothetical protein ACQ33O_09175 [Ferruginibacter sp. SUN002]|uniref:hypothetical protein n=1 Tax=Ferruginibacter sp. SUN002 TaxID=2937789 RepID=UPI003D36EDE2
MRYKLLLLLSLVCKIGMTQNESSFAMAFPITDYITPLGDSIQLVQVLMPDGLSVKEKSLGILKPKRVSGDTDTIDIGSGRCNLIKGDYYYYTIKPAKKSRLPKEGDLLYTMIELPGLYNGILYKVARHAITFSKIDETPLLSLNDVLFIANKTAEDSTIGLLVDEVKYTGNTMIAQNDNQDMVIEKGTYKDKKLFATMVNIKQADVVDCLEYIIARPSLYAGYNWKFSEVFATWMSEGAPTVIKE